MIPSVTTNEVQGGIISTPGPVTNVLVLGLSSAGTESEPTVVPSAQDGISTFGYGQGIDRATMLASYGKRVYFARLPSTAGSNGSVTHTGTGASVMTVTGAPHDSFDVIVKVTKASAVPTGAKIKVSINGGISYSAEYLLNASTAAAFALPKTGLTLAFDADTMVAGDTYAFSSTGPTFTLSDATDVIADLHNLSTRFDMVYLGGPVADNSELTAFFAALDGAKSKGLNMWGMTEVRKPNAGETMTAYETAINAAFTGATNRGAVGAYDCRVLSPIYGVTRIYNALVGALNIIDPATISENAASIGGHACVGSLTDASGRRVHNDSNYNEGLSDRFITLRSHFGQSGVYITKHRLFSAPADSMQLIIHRRLINRAEDTVNAVSATVLHMPVLAAEDGTIDDNDASRIEGQFQSALEDAVGPYCSRVIYTLDRTVNIVQTSRIKGRAKIQPFGYPEFVETDIELVASVQ